MAGAHYSVRKVPKLRLCYSTLTDRPVFRYTREYYFTQKFNNGCVWVSFQLLVPMVTFSCKIIFPRISENRPIRGFSFCYSLYPFFILVWFNIVTLIYCRPGFLRKTKRTNKTSRRCIYMWYFYSMRLLPFQKIINPPWGCFLRVPYGYRNYCCRNITCKHIFQTLCLSLWFFFMKPDRRILIFHYWSKPRKHRYIFQNENLQKTFFLVRHC